MGHRQDVKNEEAAQGLGDIVPQGGPVVEPQWEVWGKAPQKPKSFQNSLS